MTTCTCAALLSQQYPLPCPVHGGPIDTPKVVCVSAYRGRAYTSKNKARHAARNVQQTTGVKMEPYRCACGMVHIRPMNKSEISRC